MPTKNNTSQFEFAKYALQRNDEAIRYSETKASFLLALVGLLFAVIASEISSLKEILAGFSCLPTVLLVVSLALIGPGLLVLAIACLATVLPRLHVTHTPSYLYFGAIATVSETDLTAAFRDLTPEEMNRQLLAQVHATSHIAQRKFLLMRTATIAAAVVLFGCGTAVVALFLAH